jgi:hypothetical protein
MAETELGSDFTAFPNSMVLVGLARKGEKVQDWISSRSSPRSNPLAFDRLHLQISISMPELVLLVGLIWAANVIYGIEPKQPLSYLVAMLPLGHACLSPPESSIML